MTKERRILQLSFVYEIATKIYFDTRVQLSTNEWKLNEKNIKNS